VSHADNEVRRSILYLLYLIEYKPSKEILRSTLVESLKTSDEVLDLNVQSLKEAGLVETEGEPWRSVCLSRKGVITLDSNRRSYCPYL
jgi:DNA-binding IscR family transcriptional regulator